MTNQFRILGVSVLLIAFSCSNENLQEQDTEPAESASDTDTDTDIDTDTDSDSDTDECEPVDSGPCAPMDARGSGSCDKGLGTIWNGCECVEIGGCECIGKDCDSISNTVTCRVNHAECLGLQVCGGPDELECDDDSYCDRPPSRIDGFVTGCGSPQASGICEKRSSNCIAELEDTPNCGCDGKFYSSYCETNMAGVEIGNAADEDADCSWLVQSE